MNWYDRESCTNKEQAAEALADVVQCERYVILHGSDDEKQDLLDTTRDFAYKWEIPFNWFTLEENAKKLAQENDDEYEESYEESQEWEASENCW